jgi:quercetin dioxygenase-like cupin family protein
MNEPHSQAPSPGKLYTKRLGQILKDHRRLNRLTRRVVQKTLLQLLTKHRREREWAAFCALVVPAHKGSILKLEERASDEDTITIPDVQLLARAYQIPELMLDPARSELSERPLSVYGPCDFEQIAQGDIPFYGVGAQYSIPRSQMCGTENVAIVLLTLGHRECGAGGLSPALAHSDSHQHPGEEIVFLKKGGSVEIRFEESGLYARLGAGDLIHFDARLRHGAWNVAPQESESFIVRFYGHPQDSALEEQTAEKDGYSQAAHAIPEQHDSQAQREVVDRRAFGRFLRMICSERLRGKDEGFTLSQLADRAKKFSDRAKDRQYSFSRSKLDRILRGQARVTEDDLPRLAKICDIEPMTLYNYLAPDVHSAIAVHGQADMDKVDKDVLPRGVAYWLPRRRLASSGMMIAFVTLERDCGTEPNRHPGQEIIVVLEGEVGLRLGVHEEILKDRHCAHYGSRERHRVWNAGDKCAKFLCIKIIC